MWFFVVWVVTRFDFKETCKDSSLKNISLCSCYVDPRLLAIGPILITISQMIYFRTDLIDMKMLLNSFKNQLSFGKKFATFFIICVYLTGHLGAQYQNQGLSIDLCLITNNTTGLRPGSMLARTLPPPQTNYTLDSYPLLALMLKHHLHYVLI